MEIVINLSEMSLW